MGMESFYRYRVGGQQQKVLHIGHIDRFINIGFFKGIDPLGNDDGSVGQGIDMLSCFMQFRALYSSSFAFFPVRCSIFISIMAKAAHVLLISASQSSGWPG